MAAGDGDGRWRRAMAACDGGGRRARVTSKGRVRATATEKGDRRGRPARVAVHGDNKNGGRKVMGGE